jgi:hypothetical protein
LVRLIGVVEHRHEPGALLRSCARPGRHLALLIRLARVVVDRLVTLKSDRPAYLSEPLRVKLIG